jgi:predicted kinase
MDDIEDRLKTLVNKLQKRLEDKESEIIDAEIIKEDNNESV